MKIIEKYSDSFLKDDLDLHTRFTKKRHYPIDNTVIDFISKQLTSNSVIAYSGNWRFDINSTFIEESFYQQLNLNFAKSTLFVDHSNLPVLKKILLSVQCDNLIFLHSPLFYYTNIDTIIKKINTYKQLIPNIKIISAIHTTTIDFNRLNIDLCQLEKIFNGVHIDHSIVFSL
jgi:hypothetical protein